MSFPASVVGPKLELRTIGSSVYYLAYNQVKIKTKLKKLGLMLLGVFIVHMVIRDQDILMLFLFVCFVLSLFTLDKIFKQILDKKIIIDTKNEIITQSKFDYPFGTITAILCEEGFFDHPEEDERFELRLLFTMGHS